MKKAKPSDTKTPAPKDVRKNLQEKAPRSQRNDPSAGLQPNKQDEGQPRPTE
jgi:hypothetical protein